MGGQRNREGGAGEAAADGVGPLLRGEVAARSMRSVPCVGELPRLVLLSHHPRKIYGDGHLQLHREASFVSNIRTTSGAIRYCFFECTHSISTSAMQFWAS